MCFKFVPPHHNISRRRFIGLRLSSEHVVTVPLRAEQKRLQHYQSSVSSQKHFEELLFYLPLFDLGDAGEPGVRGVTVGLAGVLRLRSISFLAGDSILWVSSTFKGVLSPSGSGLVGFVFTAKQGAGPRERQNKNLKVSIIEKAGE